MLFVVMCIYQPIIKLIEDSWRKLKRNKYLINICKSVRDSSWFTSTFRSTFSAKTAYIFIELA